MSNQRMDAKTRAMVEAVAERAAKRAVYRAQKQFLLMIGLDAEEPDAVIKLQRDFAWLRRGREIGESRPMKFGVAAFSAALAFAGAIVVLLVQTLMGKLQ